MLTADLLRARIYKGVVKPTYLRGKNANAQDYAEQLCALYAGAEGWSRAKMADALEEIVGDATDFLLARGLAKLLDDRCTWASPAAYPPQELRAALYDAAFRRNALKEGALKSQRRSRTEVLQEVGALLDLSPTAIESSMFADHRDAEELVAYKAITPEELLKRYDMSLAQAVLLRAQRVELKVERATGPQLRQLIHALKFRQLLFQIERTGGEGTSGTRSKKGAKGGATGDWVLTIDGPLSILQRSTRYGLQLAMLLPVLVHFKRWSLRAQVRWPKHEELLGFELDHRTGLQATGRLRGAWISEEQKLLEERIAKHKTAWEIDPSATLIPLGKRDLFAPEMTLKHPDGRRVYVEILGTWRKSWLRKRLDLLQREGPPNTVLCVSRNMAAEKESLKEFQGEILEFAQIISLPKLLKAAEKVAVRGADGSSP